MELPYHLQTLEPLPGALDIIRYLGRIDAPNADVDEICEELDLSDRRFNKAIRRLVTKGYVQMTGDMVYALTQNGRSAVDILRAYDATSGAASASGSRTSQSDSGTVTRHLIVALPQVLAAQANNTVVVAVEGGDTLDEPADMVFRLSVVNGEPSTPEDVIVQVGDEPTQHTFIVTPGAYDQARIRVETFQLGPNPDDINISGGLYVDATVAAAVDSAASQPVAYGGTVTLHILE
jgi:DNA-binding MarR family transcriptional regulator